MVEKPPLSQSPIDLGDAVEGDTDGLAIRYNKSVIHGKDVRTTLEFPVAGGSSIVVGDTRYELKQFHFHTPSEHVVDGEFAAAEVHFVHESADGGAAVLGVLIEESEMAKGPRSLEQAMQMALLLPGSTTHYSYDGSLTTPPFTEGVKWVVLTGRIALPPAWLAAFRERYGANNRELQPLNERRITLG